MRIYYLIVVMLLAHCSTHDTVTDIDGHVYRTVHIGKQVWMAENLRVTRYRNGDPIPNITDAVTWVQQANGARCFYNNDSIHEQSYGMLYNWRAVNDKRQLAPEGWHIPTDEEIMELMHTLGGDTIAAGKLKSTDSNTWIFPNTGANNESGFAALPGGYRFGGDGSFHTMGSNGYWWSATRSYELYSWSSRLFTGFADPGRHERFLNYGLAIRCVKNTGPKEEMAMENFDITLNRLNKAKNLFPDITGEGLIASIKEEAFDTTDIDIRGRCMVVNGKPSIHAGLIATIIGGAGNSTASGKGVAPGCRLSSASFKQLIAEDDRYYLNNHITVQNHSYGTDIENYYGEEAASYDNSTMRIPALLHVFSSGNNGAAASLNGRYQDIEGFANITGTFKMAKNNIVVAAIDSFGNDIDYISKGPAYDGRLKPELSAFTSGGSSGAAAIVSGSALLVQHLYKKLYDTIPDAALVKAILINTAEDAGPKGIDFKTGYGNVRASNALRAVQDGRFFSGTVLNDQTQTFSIVIPDNTQGLKVTLVWSDPAGPNLVNDLDLTVTDANGKNWLPWVLNHFPHKDSLAMPAVRAPDHLNNTEQVSMHELPAGIYDIKVKGHHVTNAQTFYIAWDYELKDRFSWDYPVATDHVLRGEQMVIRWQQSFLGTGQLQWREAEGSWKTIEQQVDLSTNYFRWQMPNRITTAQLRMVIGTKVFESDTFSISTPVPLQVQFNCKDVVQLHWPKQQPYAAYEVYGLGNKYLERITTTVDTLVHIPAGFRYYTVVPVFANGLRGVQSAAVSIEQQAIACLVNNETKPYLVFPNPVRRGEPVTVLSAVSSTDILRLYTIKGQLLQQKMLSGTATTISTVGLPAGVYVYVINRYSGKLVIR